MEKNTEPSWYALYTKSRAEKKVYEELKMLGIETYLPLKREQRQWSDRKKWVEVPVISSYIFIKIKPQQYRDVFNARGVVAYVSHKGQAVAIPEREIEAMRRTVENKLAFSVESNTLKKGEKVTITSGPLKGIEGEVEEIQGKKKLYLRISHIGICSFLIWTRWNGTGENGASPSPSQGGGLIHFRIRNSYTSGRFFCFEHSAITPDCQQVHALCSTSGVLRTLRKVTLGGIQVKLYNLRSSASSADSPSCEATSPTQCNYQLSMTKYLRSSAETTSCVATSRTQCNSRSFVQIR